MALKSLNLTVGTAYSDGHYDPIVKNASLPAPTLTTLLADITTALGTAGGSHDSTAELTTIQTDANTLVLAMQSDVSVVWDTATITKRNQLRAALRKALAAVESGVGGLAE